MHFRLSHLVPLRRAKNNFAILVHAVKLWFALSLPYELSWSHIFVDMKRARPQLDLKHLSRLFEKNLVLPRARYSACIDAETGRRPSSERARRVGGGAEKPRLRLGCRHPQTLLLGPVSSKPLTYFLIP